MIDDEVIQGIWLAFENQSVLSTRNVTFADGSAPEAHRCEQNVVHWMVRDEAGAVFNITPLDTPTPTFAHPGSIDEFRQLRDEIHLVLCNRITSKEGD